MSNSNLFNANHVLLNYNQYTGKLYYNNIVVGITILKTIQ